MTRRDGCMIYRCSTVDARFVQFLVGLVLLDLQLYVYVFQIVVCPFVISLLAIVLSVLRFTYSEYPCGGYVLFFVQNFFWDNTRVKIFVIQKFTLGYLTKTLNQIIIFFVHQNQNIFSATLGNRIFFQKNTIKDLRCKIIKFLSVTDYIHLYVHLDIYMTSSK